jgi:CRP-like cAMP-binding protein
MKLNEIETAFLSQKLNAYADFKAEQLEKILENFESRIYPKNEYLLKEGQICNFWGFIQHGLIRSYSFNENGEDFTIGCIHEDSFVSESLSFIKRISSSVYIYALEDTTLLFVTHENLQKLFLRFPEFESFARKLYEDRMAGIKSRLLYRVQLNATDRYCHFLKLHPELVKRVPLKYIASYLNITDSTLSRIRRKISHINV